MLASKGKRGTMSCKMKRAISLMAAMLAAALLLAGCQPTPEQPIVMQKDMEQMLEKAQDTQSAGQEQTLAERYGIPERLTEEWSGADGKLTIRIDAPIAVPEHAMPIVRVRAEGFSQETATALFHHFMDGKTAMTYNPGPHVMTKADIEATILLYKQQIADGTIEAQQMMTPEEAEEEIRRLEEEYRTAPAAADDEPVVSDGAMLLHEESYSDGQTVIKERIYELSVTAGEEYLSVRRPAQDNGSLTGSLQYSADDDLGRFYNGAPRVLPENAPQSERPSLSLEEAGALCGEVFRAMGVSDVQLAQAYVTGSPGDYAYILYYVRTVAGVPAALCTESFAGSESGVSLPWNYEQIRFLVTDGGIAEMSWDSPTVAGEVVTENARLLSWQEIREIVETILFTIYEPRTEFEDAGRRIGVTIDDIQLSLLRVRENNAQGRSGFYVPAWVFYGEEYMDDFPSVVGVDKHIVLAINAVDGSVIDLAKGY